MTLEEFPFIDLSSNYCLATYNNVILPLYLEFEEKLEILLEKMFVFPFCEVWPESFWNLS